MKRTLAVAVAAALAVPLVLAQDPAKPAAPVREFTTVNIETKGVKIWVNSDFVAKKGDKVKITLINLAPSGVHAFAIKGYDVNVQVDNKEGDNKKTVEFVADKAGFFPIYCSMHPAHVGGQLTVLD